MLKSVLSSARASPAVCVWCGVGSVSSCVILSVACFNSSIVVAWGGSKFGRMPPCQRLVFGRFWECDRGGCGSVQVMGPRRSPPSHGPPRLVECWGFRRRSLCNQLEPVGVCCSQSCRGSVGGQRGLVEFAMDTMSCGLGHTEGSASPICGQGNPLVGQLSWQ